MSAYERQERCLVRCAQLRATPRKRFRFTLPNEAGDTTRAAFFMSMRDMLVARTFRNLKLAFTRLDEAAYAPECAIDRFQRLRSRRR